MVQAFVETELVKNVSPLLFAAADADHTAAADPANLAHHRTDGA